MDSKINIILKLQNVVNSRDRGGVDQSHQTKKNGTESWKEKKIYRELHVGDSWNSGLMPLSSFFASSLGGRLIKVD